MTRQFSAPADRNRQPILDVLRRVLPREGLVLEIAAGTGQHAVHFAGGLPGLTWQPSDPTPEARASIAEWSAEAALPNLRPPVELDASTWPWPVDTADAVICINMVHISPWSATEGLIAGAARILRPGGVLFLYGPYKRGGRHTAPSNAAFDADLQARNPAWGVRDLEAVERLARAAGFGPAEVVEMPANNLSVLLRRV